MGIGVSLSLEHPSLLKPYVNGLSAPEYYQSAYNGFQALVCLRCTCEAYANRCRGSICTLRPRLLHDALQ